MGAGTTLTGNVTGVESANPSDAVTLMVTLVDDEGRPWIIARAGDLRDAQMGEQYEIQIEDDPDLNRQLELGFAR